MDFRIVDVDPLGAVALSLLLQAAAMALYQAFGFRRIPPFGAYESDPTSVCFELPIGDV